MTKKSFLIYIDSLDMLDDLSDDEAGKLFKAIKSHQKNEDFDLDSLTRIAFAPFKAQFARDDEKYQSIVERNRINGLKGGRPKTQANPDKPSGLIGNPDNPNKPHSDSDSDSDSDNSNKAVGDKSPVPLQQILDAYHEYLPAMPSVQIYTDKRKAMVRTFFNKRKAEYKSKDQTYGIEQVIGYLQYIANNCKWMFEARPNGKGGFWKVKNFDYVMKEDCYVAVKEERHNDMGNT